jgi:predicted transcriptional regulator YheO
VVLNDAHDPSHSVVKIRNGHVTGRTVNSPLTDLGMEILQRKNFRRMTLGNYFTRLPDGKTLKSNAVLIYDEHGKVVGMLCINFDVTPLMAVDQSLRNLYADARPKKVKKHYTEHYQKDIPTLIHRMIDDAVHKNGKQSPRMSKKERLRVVNELYRRGLFKARGTVRLVAQALGVSNISIYKYLDEVR